MTETTITKPCCECGVPVTREPLVTPRFAHLAATMAVMCDDCGQAAEAAELERERRDAEQLRAERIAERVKASGLPAKYHRLNIDALNHLAVVLIAAGKWAKNGGGLLLSGEVGVGKTTLAGAAAWLRLQSSAVIWTSAPLLFARLGSGFGSEQRDWALDVLSSKYGLVLDDIDKARPTEYGAEQVFLAIDQRVEHEAPLLVTSNLAPSQLAEKWPSPYGEAIASRLVGYCRVIRIAGVDRRLAALGGPVAAIEAGDAS